MAKSKTNKSEAIRQYMAQHENASVTEIAKALKVQTGLVYQVKGAMAGKSKKKTGKTRGRPVASSSDTSVDQVIAAANLIKACGSTEQARQAIKAAEQIVKALER